MTPPAVHLQAPQDPPAFAALEWPGDVRDLPAAGSSWWLVLAAVLFAAAALWWHARRRRARSNVVDLSVAAPTALAALRALPLPAEPAAVVAYYGQLKALVRRHCRERFGLAADVATSEELLRGLPRQPDLQRCLLACDLVLFAAREPSPQEHADSRGAAIAFAAATGPAEAA